MFLESRCNSLVHRLDEWRSIWWQMHYFDFGMKVTHEWGVAWSIVEQQKNVEWDILLQAIFLYLLSDGHVKKEEKEEEEEEIMTL